MRHEHSAGQAPLLKLRSSLGKLHISRLCSSKLNKITAGFGGIDGVVVLLNPLSCPTLHLPLNSPKSNVENARNRGKEKIALKNVLEGKTSGYVC